MDAALKIVGGGLASLPVITGLTLWSSAENAVTWMAVVKPNARAPGGMDRRFLAKARGDGMYYIVDSLKVGDVVEFACDRIWGDERRRRRLYMKVDTISESEMKGRVYTSMVEAAQA